jgi:hypothetical protein
MTKIIQFEEGLMRTVTWFKEHGIRKNQ